QWNLRKIGLAPVETPSSGLSGWEINTGSSETIIAIVDSGIDLVHPDLINKLWINDLEQNGTPGVDDDLNGYIDDINGYNFIEDNTNIQEVLAHGSYTSGIAAASTNNNIGIAGICW